MVAKTKQKLNLQEQVRTISVVLAVVQSSELHNIEMFVRLLPLSIVFRHFLTNYLHLQGNGLNFLYCSLANWRKVLLIEHNNFAYPKDKTLLSQRSHL